MTVPELPDSLQRKLDSLPDGPGVYIWKDAAGKVLYVGKARNLRSRVRSYILNDHADSAKNQLLMRLVADVETIVVASETQSLLLENNLIKEYQPRFNVTLKDDKSYPSIAVTLRDPFPRVLVTRRRDLPGARYFGPMWARCAARWPWCAESSRCGAAPTTSPGSGASGPAWISTSGAAGRRA